MAEFEGNWFKYYGDRELKEREKNHADEINVNAEYFDKDVYSVREEDGRKIISMEYYFYRGNNSIQIVEFTGCEVNIPATRDEISDAEERCEQYQDDVSDEKYAEYCELLDGFTRLPIEEVTIDTPQGFYIDM